MIKAHLIAQATVAAVFLIGKPEVGMWAFTALGWVVLVEMMRPSRT